MTVFCDNYGCMFIDEDGFCDCDKLDIIGGVCEGSHHGGRNATENDADKRLQAENAKLRELAALGWEWTHSCCGNSCKMRTEGCGYGIDRECNYEREITDRMRELGVEVDA